MEVIILEATHEMDPKSAVAFELDECVVCWVKETAQLMRGGRDGENNTNLRPNGIHSTTCSLASPARSIVFGTLL